MTFFLVRFTGIASICCAGECNPKFELQVAAKEWRACQAHVSGGYNAVAGFLKPLHIFFNQFPVQVTQGKFFRLIFFMFGTEFQE